MNSESFHFLTPKVAEETSFVPESFRNAVLLHVVKNFIPQLDSPLMLGIQGPPGEGKSFLTRAACSALGFYVVPLCGALLSGSHEKEAVSVLEKTYMFASSLCSQKNCMTVLLIDDFDLSVAATIDDRKYTVNSQLLSGFMMNLCDDPEKCGAHKSKRIPIIATGNNLGTLYSPLTRHGRMDFFQWEPNEREKIKIALNILSPLIQQSDWKKLEKLISDYCSQPVSFFSSLKKDMVNNLIVTCFERARMIDIALIKAACRELAHQDISILKDMAERRKAMIKKNYIVKRGLL